MLNTQGTTFDISSLNLEKFGATLHLNQGFEIDYSKPIVLDIEDNENDVFVGVGLTQDGENIYYFCTLEILKSIDWKRAKIIGHNIKYDLHQMQRWGINVNEQAIYGDTMIMSYVYDTTALTHSLKPLANNFLGMEWCSYDDLLAIETEAFIDYKEGAGDRLLQYVDKITLPRVKKALKAGCQVDLMNLWETYKSNCCTLDFHDTETVANYCGSDVLATWRLWKKLYALMTVTQRRIYNTLEIDTLKELFWMECQGIQVDLDELKKLHSEFGDKLTELHDNVQALAGCTVNPNSTKQLVPILERLGLVLPLTKKKNKSVNKGFLAMHKDIPLVEALLKHSEVEKLFNTYLDGFLKIPTLPRIHSTFNQVRYNTQEDEWEGMSTNRLSSNNPNLHNIPKRGTYAKLIRQLFIPKENHVFIVGDYSQIEYRILAHLSQDETLMEAFKNGKDLHQEVANALGCDREPAKQINYATIYGAQAPKVAELAKISVQEAENLLKKHEQRFPNVYYWKSRELYNARSNGGVFTMLKRFIPLPQLQSPDRWERMRAERQAINYIIQGSAAEIIKLAMIECAKNGYNAILQVHDELIFELLNKEGIQDVLGKIKQWMENVMQLSVPIEVDINIGNSWAEAKGGKK